MHIAFRWAEGDYARLGTLAAELVERRVSVIVPVGGEVTARAAQAATSSIPVVFVIGSDPVEMGLVASLNQPGGNTTGATLMAGAVGAKRLELLRELVPGATLIGFLVNPDHPRAASDAAEVEEAARALAQQIRIVTATNERAFEAAFAILKQEGVKALIVNRDEILQQPARADHGHCGPQSAARHLQIARARGGRWAHELRDELSGNLPAGRRLRQVAS